MEKYRSEYKNEYDEEWVFEYDYASNKGTLTGSDVDWDIYPVVDGTGFDLVLNKGEINWLRASWQAAIAAKPLETTIYDSFGEDAFRVKIHRRPHQ